MIKKHNLFSRRNIVMARKYINIKHYLTCAFSRSVFQTARKTSYIVGTILTLINHSNVFGNFQLLNERFLPIFLCYLVPYMVSTYSSVKILRDRST